MHHKVSLVCKYWLNIIRNDYYFSAYAKISSKYLSELALHNGKYQLRFYDEKTLEALSNFIRRWPKLKELKISWKNSYSIIEMKNTYAPKLSCIFSKFNLMRNYLEGTMNKRRRVVHFIHNMKWKASQNNFSEQNCICSCQKQNQEFGK